MNTVSELLDNLRESFLEELPARINLIEDEILSLPDRQGCDELFRMVHSLKGSAGSHSFHIFTKITHHLEDVMLYLVEYKTLNTEYGTDFLLEYVDILKLTASSIIESKKEPSNIEQLLNTLQDKIFQKPFKILVVEPSRSYARLLEDSFHILPVKVTYVRDGLAALENLLVEKFSLLITSMETPPLNADALIAALRYSHGINSNISALLVTSYENPKMQNKEMFSLIENKNIVSKGKLNDIVTKFISEGMSDEL